MKKIIVYFNFQGAATKQYDQAWEEIRKAGYEHPKGLLHHVGGQHGNNLVVVDTWESAEAFQAFGKVLMPIVTKLGLTAEPIIIPVHYELVGEHIGAMS